MKFLHISDIHLGCDLYHIEGEERMKDYGRAWAEVLLHAAENEKIDFALIGGDLFDKKSPAPRAMIHAINGLQELKKRGIPAIAIEGNHDNKSAGKDHSWLHTLAEMKLFKLLESDISTDENGGLMARMAAWDDENCAGQYIDIGRARIFGTSWHGASIDKLIDPLEEAIRANRREGAFHILMLHTEIEGDNISPFPLLTLAQLKKLKGATDYVALGHIHKHYIIDNWAFNPGCLEITSISEFKDKHGALFIEFDSENNIAHKLYQDFYQRPFGRMKFDVSGKTPDEVYEGVFAKLRREIDIEEEPADLKRPIIEVTFEGYLGFKGSELEINKVREEIRKTTSALHVLVKNQTVPRDLPVAIDMEDKFDRRKLEKRVISDLIFRDNRYKGFSDEMADMAIEVKNKALAEESPEEIAGFISQKIREEVSAPAA